MSQRECAGFNWPGFAVSAGEPVDAGPGCVSHTARPNWSNRLRCSAQFHESGSVTSFQSRVVGVGHVANCAAIGRINPNPLPLIPLPFTASRRASHAVPVFPESIDALGVGHPYGSKEEPLSDVRRPDARSAQIGGPDGVALCFQVSSNKVEPREASSTRNLLSKDDCRAALADEA